METTRSSNGVPIRLPDERWVHITEEHCEVAGHYHDVLETVADPEAVYQGKAGELLAVRDVSAGKYLVAVYREVNQEDGFIITAFLTRRMGQIQRRTKIWPR